MGVNLFIMRHCSAGKSPGPQRLALMYNIKTALHADEPRFIRIEYLNVIVKIDTFKQQVVHNDIAAQFRESGDGSTHPRQHPLAIVAETDMGDPFSV